MAQLADKQTCTGCSACVSACPNECLSMCADENSFLYPKMLEGNKCIECGLCERTCPVLNQQKASEYKIQSFAVKSLHEDLRKRSSSGGVFSELALEIFKNNGAVYGAAYDSDFSVYHSCALDNEELYKLQGAKYAQSDLGNCFVEIEKRLQQEQQVLFAGTPCQVAGLKAYLKKDYEQLVCVDFVCHGVPSPMAWQQYISFRAKVDNQGKLPKKINLRSKHTGWSHYQYSNLYQYENDVQYSAKSSEDLFMKLFVGDYINRESCSDCPFKGYERVSDFTIGDFWGIWDIDPELDDNKGTSVVLIQSEKGQMLWNAIKDRITFKEVTLEQASLQNQSMIKASKANPERDVVLERIRNGEIADCEDIFIPQKQSAVSRIKGKASRLFHKIL